KPEHLLLELGQLGERIISARIVSAAGAHRTRGGRLLGVGTLLHALAAPRCRGHYSRGFSAASTAPRACKPATSPPPPNSPTPPPPPNPSPSPAVGAPRAGMLRPRSRRPRSRWCSKPRAGRPRPPTASLGISSW